MKNEKEKNSTLKLNSQYVRGNVPKAKEEKIPQVADSKTQESKQLPDQIRFQALQILRGTDELTLMGEVENDFAV